MEQESAKSTLSALYMERRTLRQEEKAITAVIKRAQNQLLQLQVENLEVRARLRGQGQGQQVPRQKSVEDGAGGDRKGARVRRDSISEQIRASQRQQGGMDTAPPEDEEERVNSGELDLGVEHHAILEKMMRGQFVSTEEEEDDDSA